MTRNSFRWAKVHPPALLAIAAAMGQAQGQATTDYAISIPAIGTNSPTPRALFGEFNRTPLLDAVLLRGSKLVFAYDPSLGEAGGVLEGDYLDVAVYPPFGGDEEDRLLVTPATAGPEYLTWNSQAGSFDRSTLVPDQNPPASLVGCTRVEVGQVDGNHAEDLLLLQGDRRTMALVKGYGGGDFSYVPSSVFAPSTSEDAIDVCLADGDGDGRSEIFALTSHWMECFDSDGTPLASVPAMDLLGPGSEFLGLEPLMDAAQGGENVCILARQSGQRFQLLVVDGNDFQLVQILEVTHLLPTAIKAADYDGDGLADILTNGANGRAVTCLIQKEGFLDTTNLVNVVTADAPPVSLGADVAAADLDNDGDVDLLYPVRDMDKVHLAKGVAVDHVSLSPELLTETDIDTGHLWRPTTQTLGFRFRYRTPGVPIVGDARRVPVSASHMQVMLFEAQEAMVGSGFITSPIPTSDVALSLTAPSLVQQSPWSPFPYMEWEFSAFLGSGPHKSVGYLCARYVRLGVDGSIEEAWPHTTKHFVDDVNPEGQAYVEGFPFTTSGLTIHSEDPFDLLAVTGTVSGSGSGASGGTRVGGGGGTGCIPDYPPSDPPPQDPPPPVPD